MLKIDNASVNSALHTACDSAIFFYLPDGLVVNELATVIAVAPSHAPHLYHSLSPCLRNE